MRKFRYIECKNCGILNDSRFNLCTDCGYAIKQDRAPRPPAHSIELNWRDLQIGDEVYIICSDVWVSTAGIPIYMGDSGKFKIIRLTQEGVVAYSTDIGFAFFNMVWADTIGMCNIRRKQTKVYSIGNKARASR